MSLPQLVGLECAACQRPIDSVTEAGFCHDCGNPIHAACYKMADGAGEGKCPSCGGDYSNPVAVEVRSSRPVQGQPAQFQFSPVDDPDPDLGPEVFSCRRLPGYKVLWAQGFLLGWLIYYALGPFVMLPYVALMTSMMVCFALGFDIEGMVGPGFGAVMAACYLAFFYLAYVRPLGDRLALHEKGMRIRLGFRQLAVPFGSVERLYLGRVPSTVEAGLRTALSVLKPGQSAWIASLDGTALTVVTTDGRTHVFKALLTRFEPEDLERFFLEVVGRNPRLGAYGTGDKAPA